MKKIPLLAFILLLTALCSPKDEKVEKIIKDRVEVVQNQIEPYRIRREPSNFILQEEFEIDLERKDLAEKGITEIHSFDVDSEGNIFMICINNDNNLIFKFNNKGNLTQSFGRRGQGPGEFQDCFYFRINSKDELVVTANHKILIFDKVGSILKETKINLGTSSGTILDNGNYLFKGTPVPVKERAGEMVSYLSLYDTEFRKINDLDRVVYPDPGSQEIKGIYYKLLWSVDADKIYTASQERGYEIYVYDISGNLLRKVRKTYKKIPPSDEYKENYKKNLGLRMYKFLKNRLHFPSSLPPFHCFLTDQKGRIFVMTYEEGEKSGEQIYDIFNPDGIFIFRKSMQLCLSNDFLNFSAVDYVDGRMKNKRFYCHYEKESGHTKLGVYKISWSR